MILLVDQGNSFCKWQIRVLPDGDVISQGSVSVKDVETGLAREILRALASDVSLACILVANVAGPERESVLYGALRKLDVDDMRFARVVRDFAGLQVAYANVADLGVDRWLAMLGARCMAEGSLLVLSAGTALTLDLVDASGQHLGGYIAPGLPMLTKAVASAADINVNVKIDGSPVMLGRSTQECVSFGIRHQLVSFFRCAIAQYAASVSCTIFTGGDAQFVRTHLQGDGEIEQHKIVMSDRLVLDGLFAYFQRMPQLSLKK